MKKSDYRIGNLLQIKEGGIESYPVEWFHLDPENSAIDHSQPIPLTEEWLLRFGFSVLKNGSPQRWYKQNQTNFTFYKWKSSIGISLTKCNGLGRNIQHVHQLQNLYYALTGEELTIKLAK